MDIKEKIQKAHEYVKAHNDGNENIKVLVNDAANIYAESYAEYMDIWEALQGTRGTEGSV